MDRPPVPAVAAHAQWSRGRGASRREGSVTRPAWRADGSTAGRLERERMERVQRARHEHRSCDETADDDKEAEGCPGGAHRFT